MVQDDHLIDFHFTHLVDGLGIFRKVRESHCRLEQRKIDIVYGIVFCVFIGLVNLILPVYTALHVFSCHIVNREYAVFAAGFDGHVGYAEAVVHGKRRYTWSGKLHGFVQRTVDADYSNDVKNYIFTADVFRKASGEVELQRAGNLEPGLAGGHTRGQIGGAHSGGESAQSAVGAGMGIRTDDGFACGYQTFFRKKGVFDAHLSHIIEVVYFKSPGKAAAFLALFSALYIFVRRKVVHYERDFALVEDLAEAGAFKFVDRNGTGDIVGQNHVQFGIDQLAGNYFVKSCMGGQDLLRHCHTHSQSFLLIDCSVYFTKCIFLFILFSALTSAFTEARMISACVPTPQ